MNKKIKHAFENIYLTNGWHGSESVSGDGSSLASTEAIREAILLILKKYNINLVLDAPCGDFHWMKLLDIKNYIGVDIVEELIVKLQSQYPKKQFLCLDITEDVLPKADLVICRDCIVHMQFQEAILAIENIIKSGADYLLTTTFPMHEKNEDTEDLVRWHKLNLQLSPFNFPIPIQLVSENTESNKYLGLWKVNELVKAYG